MLEIKGLQVPSFKNTKRIGGLTRWPDGSWRGNPVLITRKDVKAQMQTITAMLKSQVCSAFLTTGDGTTTGCSPPSSIAWSTHLKGLDDCWQQVEIGSVKTILVPKGEEGATIMIEEML